ncbi:MFS transporter [Flindersiella endophytica]
MKRTLETVGMYGTYGCLGYVLAGLGAILPELRAERDLPRAEAALYPSGFAVGLLVVGLFGHWITERLGRFAVPAALACLAVGTAVLATGSSRIDSGAGALALGLGGAGLVLVVPAKLRALHGDANSTVAIGEANSVSSTASVLAPLVIGAALATGLGWRAGFAGLPLVAAVVVLAVLFGAKPQPIPAGNADPAAGESAAGRAPRPFLGWWLLLVLAVAAEFCMMFWAADYLRTVKDLPATLATGASAGFLLGMAIGRAGIGVAIRLSGHPLRLLVAGATVAIAGVLVFWAAPLPLLSVAGLVVTGLGIALLYPVALGQAVASWPSHPARASARCALASGAAIGSAPLLLGALADATGIRTAFLIAPGLLALFLFAVTQRLAKAVPAR